MTLQSGQDLDMCDGTGNEGTEENYVGNGAQAGAYTVSSSAQFKQQGASYSELPLVDDGTFATAGQMLTETNLDAEFSMQSSNPENIQVFDDFLSELLDNHSHKDSTHWVEPGEPSFQTHSNFGETSPSDQVTGTLSSVATQYDGHVLQQVVEASITEVEIANKLLPVTKSPEQATHSTSSKPTQTQTRTFPCGINGCTKSYKRIYELRRHQKTHSPAKPHGCHFPFCTRSGHNGFVRKDHLRQHLHQVHGV